MKSLFEVGDINRGRAVSMVWGFPPAMTSCKGAGVMLARGVGLTQAGYGGQLWQGKSPCLRDSSLMPHLLCVVPKGLSC